MTMEIENCSEIANSIGAKIEVVKDPAAIIMNENEDQAMESEDELYVGEEVKNEPSEEITTVIEPATNPEEDLLVEMEINSEEKTVVQQKIISENSDITRIKEDFSTTNRRRSLRNELAKKEAIRTKPPKYDEIFNCYKRKEYKECLIYLDLIAETTQNTVEYQILRATCYAYLGIKLNEAHRILDEILKQKPEYSYCIYAKGLVLYEESRWQEAIDCFDKAIALENGHMQRAEVLRRLAFENMAKSEEEESSEDESSSSEGGSEASIDNQMDADENDEEEDDQSQGSSETSSTRFQCELCEKYFAKKFNLDRHNKTFHNRETPFIPPLQRTPRIRVPIDEDEEEDEEFVEEVESPVKIKKEPKLKIRLDGRSVSGGKIKKKKKIAKNGMVKCNICNNYYSKGSLARHQIIHTGIKGYTCEECGKAFYQKSDLERHVTIHSDVFDHQCNQCDKKFRIKKNLQVHIKRHHSK